MREEIIHNLLLALDNISLPNLKLMLRFAERLNNKKDA
ncbi:hypothetical protein J2Z43_001083 [Clostridioides mangenotii]|uniref:Uncharacterized protein n=1 Tax=Metaclostridioides mangenotii TaxID=1540 RepID=A0ABS4E9V9_9FIRM|nr:hypothetical protein [Clostridioides mangenotii]